MSEIRCYIVGIEPGEKDHIIIFQERMDKDVFDFSRMFG